MPSLEIVLKNSSLSNLLFWQLSPHQSWSNGWNIPVWTGRVRVSLFCDIVVAVVACVCWSERVGETTSHAFKKVGYPVEKSWCILWFSVLDSKKNWWLFYNALSMLFYFCLVIFHPHDITPSWMKALFWVLFSLTLFFTNLVSRSTGRLQFVLGRELVVSIWIPVVALFY